MQVVPLLGRICALCLSLQALSTGSLAGAGEAAFFAFDNGVGREQRWSPARQAAVLRELGYSGIGYSGVDDFEERAAAFAAAGLRIYSVYVGLQLDGGPDGGAAIRAALPLLGAAKSDVWLTLRGRGVDDAAAVRAVRDLADDAANHGVRIVLYPHKGFLVATAEEGLRIVRQVGRPNVGGDVQPRSRDRGRQRGALGCGH